MLCEHEVAISADIYHYDTQPMEGPSSDHHYNRPKPSL
jgi:hypothetical protein